MERTLRPLTRRPRAFIACDTCRQTKAKCDGNAPTCERCNRLDIVCVYSQNTRDKRMERQADRKTNADLRTKVRELESRLAAANRHSPTPASSNGVSVNAAAGESLPLLASSTMGHTDTQRRASSRQTSSSDSPVDVLAAGVFDHPSAGYICYFGWSSNHALFWSLSASIANLGHRSSRLYQEPLLPGVAQKGPMQLPQPPSSSISAYGGTVPHEGIFPGAQVASKWISRFFDTVGAVVPYVTEPALLEGMEKMDGRTGHGYPVPCSLQALLSIVFAHALSTLDEGSPEPFYRRTLSLLDPKTLYVSSLELLQTLLLLSIFQQNSQRSTESWTTHSLAVKTAYQLGIHAPSSYEFVQVHEKEFRSRLWFAVVNQDRMLSSALGQPSLVPSQHVRMDITDMLAPARQGRTVEMPYSRENLAYFRNIISLHEIMGITVESVYGSNISSSSCLSLEELVARTLDLSLRLGRWRNSGMAVGIIASNVDFNRWSPSLFDVERNSILTSIFYYRTVLLVHGSLLMVILEMATNGAAEVSSGILQDTVQSLLKNDFVAVTEFHHLIRGILQHKPSFLKRNAIWWTCNYAVLTLCLHLFGFWVASNSAEASFVALGMDSSELETRLRSCLDTLKAIGVSSAMSVKAHRCLQRHLHFLASAASSANTGIEKPGVTLGSNVMADMEDTRVYPNEAFPHASGPDFMTNPNLELFGNLGDHDFANVELLCLELGVSDSDATAFI